MKVHGGVEVQNSHSYSQMEVILLAGEEIPVPMEWEAEWTSQSRYERLAGQKIFLPVTGNQTPIPYYLSRYYYNSCIHFN